MAIDLFEQLTESAFIASPSYVEFIFHCLRIVLREVLRLGGAKGSKSSDITRLMCQSCIRYFF